MASASDRFLGKAQAAREFAGASCGAVNPELRAGESIELYFGLRGKAEIDFVFISLHQE